MDAIEILLPAFVLCVLMLLTHSYFGLHVLSRGIIFVDLALAQIAALGISIAFLFGEETHGYTAQISAFVATLLASFLFAKLRRLPNKVTREVTIGCVYVVSTALTTVILSRSSQGMEELKAIFNGNILWVSWEEIAIVFCIYLIISIFHLIYRKKFYQLSFADTNVDAGFLWEFLFFASFAIIITLAVNLAGILLVFAFLIIPAFSASMLIKGFTKQLIFSWMLALLGCLAGLYSAYALDLPVGATVVSVLGFIPVSVALFVIYKAKNHKVVIK